MAEKNTGRRLGKKGKKAVFNAVFCLFLSGSLFFLTQCSCRQKKEESPIKTDISEEMNLSFVSFSELKGWQEDDLTQVLPALRASCLKNSPVWNDFCSGLAKFSDIPAFEGKKSFQTKSPSDDTLEQRKKEIRAYLEKSLTPYQVMYAGKKDGVFTGYYEASLNGSFEKTKKYSVPIRSTPTDMVKVDWAAFGKSGMPPVVGRVENAKLVPYFTRRQIEEQSEDKAPVLLWVDDAVDKFILQIQGSGRVKMPDGSFIRIGYADSNGLPFVGISSLMREKGVLEKGKGSMPDIRAWLRAHPQQAKEIMNGNHRYIFFQVIEKNDSPLLPDGPTGAQGVHLTAGRSMAVDTGFVPLGTPLWLQTTDADGNPLHRLVVAQDIGSAIKGGIRGDFFWGFGEQAFQKAGRMNSSGTYFLLLPKGVKLTIQKGKEAFLLPEEEDAEKTKGLQ